MGVKCASSHTGGIDGLAIANYSRPVKHKTGKTTVTITYKEIIELCLTMEAGVQPLTC